MTRETAASVRADCALTLPGHFAMAKMARAIRCSLRRGFALSQSRHSQSAALRQLDGRPGL
jgi:hypothetical protein